MKLVTYLSQGRELVGILEKDAVWSLPYSDMQSLIESAPNLDRLPAEAQLATPLSEVRLLAPIPRPRQDVICLGINYRAHEEEAARYNGTAFQRQKPIYFSKRVTEAVPPGGAIQSHPGLVERLDYEAELAVILGRTARSIRAEEAGGYIFGYTILNDVSARRLQTERKQWYFGKGLDGFTPMGPCILTADAVPFPPALDISSRVNGEERQHSNTDCLITGIPEILEELSSGMTLLAGTIIATGTPAGVGMGFDPPRFLKTGDRVACSIEDIGTLENIVE